MEEDKKKIHISDILLFLVFLLLLAFPAYLCYQLLVTNTQNSQATDTSTTETTEQTAEETSDTTEEEIVPTGPQYEEMFQEVSDQMAYIAVPTNTDTSNPPAIVLYSHGSNTVVTDDTTDSFIQDLQSYGEYFATSNFVFAASNEHGANWGNDASVKDMNNLVNWIEENYTTSNKIYLIGFSMGGLPTMHYVLAHHENIVKVALLAPTTHTYDWSASNINKLDDIDIKIWHGTSDVNIGISNTIEFVDYMENLGKDITLIQLKGKTHFDVDTEYMDQILEFFQAD